MTHAAGAASQLIGGACSRPLRGFTFIGLLIIIVIWFNPVILPSFHKSTYDTIGRTALSASEQIAKNEALEFEAPRPTTAKESRIRQATMIYANYTDGEIYRRCIETHEKHGLKWGYETHVLEHHIYGKGFFNKPAYLLGLIIGELARPSDKRADWMVWFDADSIILNDEIPWSTFLPPSDFQDIHMLSSKDHNGFNAGVFMLRVHPWSVQLLSAVLALRQYEPTVYLEYDDQSAIAHVFEKTGYKEHMLFQPADWWNNRCLAPKPYAVKTLLMHFAGSACYGNPGTKMDMLSLWLARREANPGDYVMPYQKTAFPETIPTYWHTIREARRLLNRAKAVAKGNNYDNEAQRDLAQKKLEAAVHDFADDAGKMGSAIYAINKVLQRTKLKPEAG